MVEAVWGRMGDRRMHQTPSWPLHILARVGPGYQRMRCNRRDTVAPGIFVGATAAVSAAVFARVEPP